MLRAFRVVGGRGMSENVTALNEGSTLKINEVAGEWWAGGISVYHQSPLHPRGAGAPNCLQ